MLTVSQDAATLVRSIADDADLSDDAGLRIVIHPTHKSLSMGLAHHAEPDDVTVTSNGAHVFLSRPASKRLSRGTLRAEITDQRSAFFLDR